MHVALVMNNASGVETLRADLIRFLQSMGHHVTVICAPDSAVANLKKMGVSFVSWAVSRRGMNPFIEALALFELRKILSHAQPTIVLCFTPKPVLYGSLAAHSMRRTYVFSVFAGLGFLFSSDTLSVRIVAPLVHYIFRLALKSNPIVFFQNPDDQYLFVSKRIVPRDRTCRVYGSGVDTARFMPTPQRVPRAHTIFLMIARLIAPKGVLEYIQAASILKRDGYHARAMLLGPFDDHPTAIDPRTIRSSEESGVIEYLGTATDVRPFLDDADVFVLPSYYREGTPRSTLEAMAMGKPIITTDAPGCRETVIDNSNGYLVPARNSAKLADAMKKLVGNHGLIKTMGQKSRSLAVDLYDVGKVNRHVWRQVIQSMPIAFGPHRDGHE